MIVNKVIRQQDNMVDYLVTDHDGEVTVLVASINDGDRRRGEGAGTGAWGQTFQNSSKLVGGRANGRDEQTKETDEQHL
jgi:hypothetical protein